MLQILRTLKKLIKHFPLQDEFVIKWAYYQYLDYKETYKQNRIKEKILYLKKIILQKKKKKKKKKILK